MSGRWELNEREEGYFADKSCNLHKAHLCAVIVVIVFLRRQWPWSCFISWLIITVPFIFWLYVEVKAQLIWLDSPVWCWVGEEGSYIHPLSLRCLGWQLRKRQTAIEARVGQKGVLQRSSKTSNDLKSMLQLGVLVGLFVFYLKWHPVNSKQISYIIHWCLEVLHRNLLLVSEFLRLVNLRVKSG